jgi:hypothetical protein
MLHRRMLRGDLETPSLAPKIEPESGKWLLSLARNEVLEYNYKETVFQMPFLILHCDRLVFDMLDVGIIEKADNISGEISCSLHGTLADLFWKVGCLLLPHQASQIPHNRMSIPL